MFVKNNIFDSMESFQDQGSSLQQEATEKAKKMVLTASPNKRKQRLAEQGTWLKSRRKRRESHGLARYSSNKMAAAE